MLINKKIEAKFKRLKVSGKRLSNLYLPLVINFIKTRYRAIFIVLVIFVAVSLYLFSVKKDDKTFIQPQAVSEETPSPTLGQDKVKNELIIENESKIIKGLYFDKAQNRILSKLQRYAIYTKDETNKSDNSQTIMSNLILKDNSTGKETTLATSSVNNKVFNNSDEGIGYEYKYPATYSWTISDDNKTAYIVVSDDEKYEFWKYAIDTNNIEKRTLPKVISGLGFFSGIKLSPNQNMLLMNTGYHEGEGGRDYVYDLSENKFYALPDRTSYDFPKYPIGWHENEVIILESDKVDYPLDQELNRENITYRLWFYDPKRLQEKFQFELKGNKNSYFGDWSINKDSIYFWLGEKDVQKTLYKYSYKTGLSKLIELGKNNNAQYVDRFSIKGKDYLFVQILFENEEYLKEYYPEYYNKYYPNNIFLVFEDKSNTIQPVEFN